MTERFLCRLQKFAAEIGLSKDRENMFNNYFIRNNEPLSQKLINDLNESEGLLSFVLKNSTPIKHKINKENLSLFEKERHLSENQYMQERKEDNMLFEEYLEHFRGEIK